MDPLYFTYHVLRLRNKKEAPPAFLIDCDQFFILYIPAQEESKRIGREELGTFRPPNFQFGKYDFQIVSPAGPTRDMHLRAFATAMRADPATLPPVNRHTEVFYSTICRDWRFLFFVVQLPHFKEEKTELFDGWLDAVGADRVEMLLQFLIYSNFSDLDGPNLVFRGNSFLTTILCHVIRKDSKFGQFLNAIAKIDIENAVPCFLDAFAKAEFGPLALHIVRSVYMEGKRCFPQSEACLFGISGLLFLRIMVPVLLANGREKGNSIMKQLQTCYNFQTGEAANSAEITRLKELIREKVAHWERRPVTCGEFTFAAVEPLIKRAVGFASEFFGYVNAHTVEAKYERYRQRLNDPIEI
jgi:hypothetical protein